MIFNHQNSNSNVLFIHNYIKKRYYTFFTIFSPWNCLFDDLELKLTLKITFNPKNNTRIDLFGQNPMKKRYYTRSVFHREGHGAMLRARSFFVNCTACRAVSNSAWSRIFRETSCFSPFNIGTLFRCCVLGQGTSNASLDSGENEYLVGQRWQCV